VAFIQSTVEAWKTLLNKTVKLVNQMQIAFVFAGLNLNIITQKRAPEKMHVLCILLAKTRGIKYFNVDT